MFRSSTTMRELVLCLAKVMLEHSVKLCPYRLCTFHKHKLLISEQQISDINPLYELADMSQIQLQKNAPLLRPILHSTQHTRHSQSHSAQHTTHTPVPVSFCTAHNTHATPR
jgi:hypothetical protein